MCQKRNLFILSAILIMFSTGCATDFNGSNGSVNVEPYAGIEIGGLSLTVDRHGTIRLEASGEISIPIPFGRIFVGTSIDINQVRRQTNSPTLSIYYRDYIYIFETQTGDFKVDFDPSNNYIVDDVLRENGHTMIVLAGGNTERLHFEGAVAQEVPPSSSSSSRTSSSNGNSSSSVSSSSSASSSRSSSCLSSFGITGNASARTLVELKLRPYTLVDDNEILTIPFNATISILDGPSCANGYIWWQVSYAGYTGWSAEGGISGSQYISGSSSTSSSSSSSWPPSNRYAAPSNGHLLSGGQGMTNGAVQNYGDFQVEGYCTYIGSSGVSENGINWYCDTRQLTISDFDSICRLTYNNSSAAAFRSGSSSTVAYNWRCFGPN